MTVLAASARGTGKAGQQEEPDPEHAGQAERARALSLIDFLAEYDALRNPPVHDITKRSPFLLAAADLPRVPGVSLTPSRAAWLTVDFLELPPAPLVPAHLVPLLGDSWSITATTRPEINSRWTRSGSTLQRAAEEWIARDWEPFAAESSRVAVVKRLHRDLFQQREFLSTDRATRELVWGFGRLRWDAGGTVIDHPLVTIPAEISEDADTQRLQVAPAGAPQVETRFLTGLTLADRAGYMSIAEAVEESGLDLWDAGDLETVLQLLIRAVDEKGTLADRAPQGPARAVADASWTLWMRRRLPDYHGFLTRLRELYCDPSAAVSGALAAIVSDAPSALPAADSAAGEPLLLPLPANEEQQRILDRASRAVGVTVQGPPGTGKSHTIANIISHYTAYGKRVLVVAEKEQALRSLIDKIPAQISDLTMAVVGEDTASRRELEAAIGHIQSRVSTFDTAFAGERTRQLTGDLDAVRGEIDATAAALLAARQADVEQLEGTWPAGDAPTRAQAARWVAAHADTLGYIDDALTPDTAPPVDAGELAGLAALIRQVGTGQAEACAAVLPDLASVPAAGDLESWYAQLQDMQAAPGSPGSAAPDWDKAAAAGAAGLRALAARCQEARDWLTRTAGSWPEQVRGHVADPQLAGVWELVSAQLARDRQEALSQRAVLAAHTVAVPDIIEPWLADGLRQARGRMAASGRLGRFAAPARRAAQECRVDGRLPSTAEDFELCLAAVSLATTRQRMVTAWHSQLGQALDDARPEDALGPLLPGLRRAIDWPHTWAQLRGDLSAAGIHAPDHADAGSLGALADACTQSCDQLALVEVSRSAAGLEQRLRSGGQVPGASPLWELLADALARRDVPRWARLRAELAELTELAPAARRLSQLRDRLTAVAPVWTARILADPAAAGNPADFERAWQWRQLDTWIDAGLAGSTPGQLQARLEDLSGRQRALVTELVAERAWARLAAGLGDSQRQALNSYVRAVTRFGRTGGKFAQRWLNEIQAALNEAKDAIPVWIMPVSRALTSFRPGARPPFDVLIVDEASQIGIDALPLLALADQTIVVGDDKQVSPDHVGLKRQQVFDSLDQHLAAIPGHRMLFDPDASLYDLAFQKFPGVVMLTEHFRCLPPIIAFSNARSYDNRIIPLRDRAPRPGWAAVAALRVADGHGWAHNEPEASAVVDLIARLCEDPDYAGLDMGVISLLGTDQSKLIADKLYDRLGPQVLAQRRLRSGEAASFQGDERDVIIISTVVSPGRSWPRSAISAMLRQDPVPDRIVVVISAGEVRHRVQAPVPGRLVGLVDDLRPPRIGCRLGQPGKRLEPRGAAQVRRT